jgi:hypothetical protein
MLPPPVAEPKARMPEGAASLLTVSFLSASFVKIPAMADGFIPQHGGYENLLSFQKARIVYDGTVWFCNHFLEKRPPAVRVDCPEFRVGSRE